MINLPVGFRADGTDGGDTLRIDGNILRVLAYGKLGRSCFDSLALSTLPGMAVAEDDPAPEIIQINDACNSNYIGKQFRLELFHTLSPGAPFCELLVNILPRIVCGTDTLACNDTIIVKIPLPFKVRF